MLCRGAKHDSGWRGGGDPFLPPLPPLPPFVLPVSCVYFLFFAFLIFDFVFSPSLFPLFLNFSQCDLSCYLRTYSILRSMELKKLLAFMECYTRVRQFLERWIVSVL